MEKGVCLRTLKTFITAWTSSYTPKQKLVTAVIIKQLMYVSDRKKITLLVAK
jgi:hypothetical protein